MPHYNNLQRGVLGSVLENSLSSTSSLQQGQYSKPLRTLYSFLVHLHIDQHECSMSHRISEFLEDLLASATAFGPSESTNTHRQKLRRARGRWKWTSRVHAAFLSHSARRKRFQKNPQSPCTQCGACSCGTVLHILFPYINAVPRRTKACSAAAVHNCRALLGEQSRSWPSACESC